MKIVVDANIYASALIKPKSNSGRIIDFVKQNQLELVISPSIIKEIKRILLYPKIRKYHGLNDKEIDKYFEEMLIFAWLLKVRKNLM